jgi:cysteinyl-tRNA synthetase
MSRDEALTEVDLRVLIGAFEAVLAIGLLDLTPEDVEASTAPVALNTAEIAHLLARREEARQTRDFATADEIRRALEQNGIEIRDTPAGPTWKPLGQRANAPDGDR